MRPNRLIWSFQSGPLPRNTRVNRNGSLSINSFSRSNLGIYTCSAAANNNKRIAQSIDFQPQNIFQTPEPLLSLQPFSSRSEYRFGGRLILQCVSSGNHLHFSFIKNFTLYL